MNEKNTYRGDAVTNIEIQPCRDVQACVRRQEKRPWAYTETHLKGRLRSLHCDGVGTKQRSLE